MRITLFVSSLSSGGAERVAANLATTLDRQGHSVTILVKEGKQANDYSLPGAVRVKRLSSVSFDRSIRKKLAAITRRFRLLHEELLATRPDVLVSFTTPLNVRTLLSAPGVPVVITEHNHPKRASTSAKWRLLRRLVYPRASRLVSVSRGVDAHFAYLPAARRAVIYNGLPPGILEQYAATPELELDPKSRWFLACGRLVPQKGFDMLLRSFSRFTASRSGKVERWSLAILGEGPDRQQLISIRDPYNLDHAVLLVGRVANPFAVFRQADAFVLSSRYEGFGNVLVEAMAGGLPPVSFDCPYGPAEIIEHECSGLLVPPEDEDAMAQAMMRVADNPDFREVLAQRAEERSRDFSWETTGKQWEHLLRGVVESRA